VKTSARICPQASTDHREDSVSDRPLLRIERAAAPLGAVTAGVPPGAATKTYIVTTASADEAALDERHHDLRNALRRIETLVMLVRKGYRFDDDQAATYTDLLDDARRMLQVELEVWRPVYEP
jgi:hypothetical protein